MNPDQKPGTKLLFDTYTGSFDVSFDTADNTIQTATLNYPNDTTVTLTGDPEVITQIISALQGVLITYKVKDDTTDATT